MFLCCTRAACAETKIRNWFPPSGRIPNLLREERMLNPTPDLEQQEPVRLGSRKEKQLHSKAWPMIFKFENGLLRELNPGPLAPWARIMPLDQAATNTYRISGCLSSFSIQILTFSMFVVCFWLIVNRLLLLLLHCSCLPCSLPRPKVLIQKVALSKDAAKAKRAAMELCTLQSPTQLKQFSNHIRFSNPFAFSASSVLYLVSLSWSIKCNCTIFPCKCFWVLRKFGGLVCCSGFNSHSTSFLFLHWL